MKIIEKLKNIFTNSTKDTPIQYTPEYLEAEKNFCFDKKASKAWIGARIDSGNVNNIAKHACELNNILLGNINVKLKFTVFDITFRCDPFFNMHTILSVDGIVVASSSIDKIVLDGREKLIPYILQLENYLCKECTKKADKENKIIEAEREKRIERSKELTSNIIERFESLYCDESYKNGE